MSDRYGPASRDNSSSGSNRQPYAPPPHTVQRGTVTRLEPYGCFVQLSNYRARGLVHKSQLASYRVDNVDDAVTVNDGVYVKVVEVVQEPHEDGSGRIRHKVSLSMKYADQDDGTDLDPSGERAAEELARRGGGGGGAAEVGTAATLALDCRRRRTRRVSWNSLQRVFGADAACVTSEAARPFVCPIRAKVRRWFGTTQT